MEQNGFEFFANMPRLRANDGVFVSILGNCLRHIYVENPKHHSRKYQRGQSYHDDLCASVIRKKFIYCFRQYLSGENLSLIQKSIYYWAFDTAKKYHLEGMSSYYKMKLKIADKLIYSKWRAAIGGNFEYSCFRWFGNSHQLLFSAIGMPVFEGYGLSETSPVIVVSQRGKNGRKFGTV